MLSPADYDTLQAYLDGELSPDEAAAVEARLKSDGELADALLLLAREEAILTDWARVAGRATEVEAGLAAQRTPTLKQRASYRWFAIAVALLVGIGAVWLSRQPATPEPAMARVEHFAGQVFTTSAGSRGPVSAGLDLQSGQGLELVGEDALAVIVYADGTRLEFDGDTVVTELSAGRETGKRVQLASGNVRADVAKQPPDRPMILKTANAQVVVLGTRFDLSGSPQGTYVETAEGAVRLVRADDGRAIEVPAGFEGRADNQPEMAAQPSPPRFRRSRLATPGYERTTALSPDGQTLVTTRFGSGTVSLWTVADGHERLTFTAHRGQVEATAFSNDGQRLATGATDLTIKVWNAATGQELQTLVGPDRLQGLSFSADGSKLWAIARVSQNDLRLHSWDLATGQESDAAKALRGELWAFSPDGKLLAWSSARDRNVTILDLATGRERAVIPKLPTRVLCLALSPDPSRVAISEMSGRVTLFDIDSGRELQTISPPGGSAQGLTFSPDGAELAIGLRYATVRVWDLATGKQRYVLEGAKRPGATASVRPMFFTPDQRTLATTESLGESVVRLWDLPAR